MTHALLLIARWTAVAHDRWRSETARRRPLRAEDGVLREALQRLREEKDLLRTRLRRLDPRRRPRYRPFERLWILWHQARHGRSVRATARAFVLSAQTVIHWHGDVASGRGRLVQLQRPGNALPDLVAKLVHRLKGEWPRWETRRVAGILTRIGLAASRTSVQRILRQPYRPNRRARVERPGRGPLISRHPGHVWLLDFTRVGGPLRSVRVGAVIDAFSRRVLAIGAVPGEPTAAFAVRLLREAVRAAGIPDWVVTDHGRQFTSLAFTRALRRRGIRRRYGAIGQSGSIALIERFWRSLKNEYAGGLFLYRPLRAIGADLARYAKWYNAERPHQGLGNRTPEEVHAGRTRPFRLPPTRAVLRVRYLEDDRALPVLRLRHAA